MKRNVRESTTAKSDLLKDKLKQRELERKKRKSRKLLKLADKNSASISEALELSVIGKDQSSDSELSEKSDTSVIDTTEDNLSAQSGSQEEYWYDNSNTELTGLQEFPVTPQSDCWSYVNRFFPRGCFRSPKVPITRASSLPAIVPGQIVQNSDLTTSESHHNQSSSIC